MIRTHTHEIGCVALIQPVFLPPYQSRSVRPTQNLMRAVYASSRGPWTERMFPYPSAQVTTA